MYTSTSYFTATITTTIVISNMNTLSTKSACLTLLMLLLKCTIEHISDDLNHLSSSVMTLNHVRRGQTEKRVLFATPLQ